VEQKVGRRAPLTVLCASALAFCAWLVVGIVPAGATSLDAAPDPSAHLHGLPVHDDGDDDDDHHDNGSRHRRSKTRPAPAPVPDVPDPGLPDASVPGNLPDPGLPDANVPGNLPDPGLPAGSAPGDLPTDASPNVNSAGPAVAGATATDAATAAGGGQATTASQRSALDPTDPNAVLDLLRMLDADPAGVGCSAAALEALPASPRCGQSTPIRSEGSAAASASAGDPPSDGGIGGALPVNGAETAVLAAVGVILLAAGVILRRIQRRSSRGAAAHALDLWLKGL
jgi:hypothetical protein